MEKSVYPDQVTSTDLDLLCFRKRIYPGSAVQGLIGVKHRYSRASLKQPLKRRPKIVFQDRLSLNARQKYCRMLKESILQYFRPAISYHLSLRPLFFLLLSDRLEQFYIVTVVYSTTRLQDVTLSALKC